LPIWKLADFDYYMDLKPTEKKTNWRDCIERIFNKKKGGWGGMLITNITACQKEIVLFSLYEKAKSPYTAAWKFKNK
jgi:hypothetical protein